MSFFSPTPLCNRMIRTLSHMLGLMVCAVYVTGCGGGGKDSPVTTPVVVPEPAIVNAVGPGQFTDAVLLKTIATTEVTAALDRAGSSAFRATSKYAVKAYRMTYLTVDGQGQQILASALVTVPQKAASALSPVLSYQHGTLTKGAEAPSNLPSLGNPEVVLASTGYIVLSADYVGYGVSKGASHPYLLAAPSASAVIDMLTAAKYWLQRQGVADNKQLFLAGYSEGGYVTVAAHRALQAGTSSYRTQIVSVAPGAGPYNVGLSLDEELKLVAQVYPLLGSVLNPGFLKLLGDVDRRNVRDELLRQVLGADSDVIFMPTVIDNYLADNRAAIVSQSNVHDWLPTVPVNLFHGRDDRTVSYLSSTGTLQAMQSRGAGNRVSLTDCVAQPAGHPECVLPYWRFMLDTFGKVAKDL